MQVGMLPHSSPMSGVASSLVPWEGECAALCKILSRGKQTDLKLAFAFQELQQLRYEWRKGCVFPCTAVESLACLKALVCSLVRCKLYRWQPHSKQGTHFAGTAATKQSVSAGQLIASGLLADPTNDPA